MGPWIFHGLAALALLAFCAGAARRLRPWLGDSPAVRRGGRWTPALAAVRRGLATAREPRALRAFAVDGLLLRRMWRVSPLRWAIHACLAWSFAGLFVVGSLGDMASSLGVPLHKNDAWFATVNDAFGLVLLAGVVLAAGRRMLAARPHPRNLFDDGLALSLLGVLAAGGFLVEAARILEHGTPGTTSGYAFAGYGLSRALEPLGADWGAVHDWLWWSHALMALGLVAYLPYSKLFHMFASPAAIAWNAGAAGLPRIAASQAVPVAGALVPIPLVRASRNGHAPLLAGHFLQLDACTRCGECMRACGSFQATGDESVAIMGMIRQRRQLHDPGGGSRSNGNGAPAAAWDEFQQAVFSCTLCGRCEAYCPVGIRTRDLALALRTELATARCMMPRNLELTREAVLEEGNVFRFPNEDRALWAEFLDGLPPDLLDKEQADVLYFVGCVSSFSPAIQEIPQAFLQVLLKAGVDVALLAGKERCCGFPLIMGGLAGDAQALIEHNMAEVRRLGAKTVVFNCPSCYYTWKKFYPLEGIRLAHSTEVIRDLVQSGRLAFAPGEAAVTYHDPCDLGRGLGQYDAPRDVLKGFAKGNYVELSPSREAALCCGGGGDVEMWDPGLVGEVNNLLTDAVERSGAALLVQACPQCKRVTQRGLEGRQSRVRTLDIAELALEFGTFDDTGH